MALMLKAEKTCQNLRKARRLAGQAGFLLCLWRPFHFSRSARLEREKSAHYLEVFLDVPEEECRRRDPKGLYAANVPNMAGKQTKAEFPEQPHLRLDGSQALGRLLRLRHEIFASDPKIP